MLTVPPVEAVCCGTSDGNLTVTSRYPHRRAHLLISILLSPLYTVHQTACHLFITHIIYAKLENELQHYSTALHI